MSAAKNHHFVPQFYFRRFSKDQRSVCSVVRSTGKVIAQASIKGQASKNLFYGDAEVEKALSEIEGFCSAALRELDTLLDPAMLPEDKLLGLYMHLVLQHSRTPAARAAALPFQDRMMQLMLEVALNNDTELDDETKATMRESLPNIGADPLQAQRMEMGIAMKSATVLADLRPLVLVNKTNRPFIFGDAPVVFYNAACWNVKLRGVLGMASYGLMVLMPLSSEKYLLLLDEGAYDVRAAPGNRVAIRDLRDVQALNKLQLHASSDCAYFEDVKFERYVHALWLEERKHLKGHEGMVVEAPNFDAASGAPLGDIVHGFHPQLPYQARFSFLRYQVVGDEDNRPLQRPTCVMPDDAGPWPQPEE